MLHSQRDSDAPLTRRALSGHYSAVIPVCSEGGCVTTPFSALGRFADVSFLVLASLASGPKHGYAMLEDIARFSGTRLEPGPLYAALLRLGRRGWIELLPSEDRQHPYRLTLAGLAVLREQVARLGDALQAGRQRLATRDRGAG
jgi:DNA-binding PadR family transcriptional regulator